MKFLDKLVLSDSILGSLPLYTEGSFSLPDDWKKFVVGSTSLRSDNFNRANSSSLGTPSDAGSNWIDLNSAGRISSNRAIGNPGMSTGEYHPVALTSTVAMNVYVEATLTQIGKSSGIIYDYNDSLGAGLESYSGFVCGTDWASACVLRVEGGSVLYTIPIGMTVNDGDVVAFITSEANGYLYINDVLIYPFPLANNGNAKQGMLLSNNSIIENFSTSLENDASQTLNLYTYGAYVARNSLTLFVEGSGFPCSSPYLPLVCWNDTIVGSLPLYVIGEGSEDGAFPISNSLMLFVKAPYGASLPLYTLGGPQPSANLQLPLYTCGSGISTSSLPLSVPNVMDTKTKSITLYTHGF